MTEKTITVTSHEKPTEAEISIVQLMSDGKRPSEIAAVRGAKTQTIRNQIFQAKKKFGESTNGGLVALFMRNNLIK